LLRNSLKNYDAGRKEKEYPREEKGEGFPTAKECVVADGTHHALVEGSNCWTSRSNMNRKRENRSRAEYNHLTLTVSGGTGRVLAPFERPNNLEGEKSTGH